MVKMDDVPKDLEVNYPDPGHPFWNKFNDPFRAYYNLIGMIRYYRESGKSPIKDAEDYSLLAYWIANEVKE